MSDKVEFELRVPNNVSKDELRTTFEKQLSSASSNFSIEKFEKVEAVGMTTPDLIISIIVSAGSSAAIHVYRDQIDAAAKNVGEVLKTDVRTLFKGERKSIEEDE